MHRRAERTVISALLAITILLYAVPATAEDSPLKSNTINTILRNVTQPQMNLKGMSLLDPERFSSRNQYMMNFSSVGGNGSMVGMFINTMEYRFNCPLVMRVKVAYETKTGQLFGDSSAFTGLPNNNAGRLFVPSFDLVYQPFENTTISFHYRDMTSAYYQSMYGYGFGRMGYSPFGYSPYRSRW